MIEFKCTEGKLYLSLIKDLFNDEIIAYDVAGNSEFWANYPNDDTIGGKA